MREQPPIASVFPIQYRVVERTDPPRRWRPWKRKRFMIETDYMTAGPFRSVKAALAVLSCQGVPMSDIIGLS
jgi:hypothetical protein